MSFDPNGTGQKDSGIFALPFSEEEAQIIFIPVPWEVTTSFGHGTSLGPDAIYTASKQLDLCDAHYGEFYKMGLFQQPTNIEWLNRSRLLKEKALHLRDLLENGKKIEAEDLNIQSEINEASNELNTWLYNETNKVLEENKWACAIGGDHSSPYGLMKALKEKYEDMSVLHIDAHMDLRKAYQGYEHSHASIMYNVMNELNPTSLVQMGIRDFCPEEAEISEGHKDIHTFYDSKVNWRLAQGERWKSICEDALSKLSGNVYISFDIDGLMPDLCPNTGTPVPGGLSFSQMESLLYQLSQSGKKVVGFDLNEVAPESEYDFEGWDANVGARVLFKLTGCLLASNK